MTLGLDYRRTRPVMENHRVPSRRALIAAVMLSVIFSPVLRGQQEPSVYIHGGNAEALVNDCDKTGPYCLGYILGVVDMHSALNAAVPNTKDNNYCVPDNATATQLAKVVVKFGKEHPEELNEAALVMVFNAFVRAFPCK